MNPCSSLILVPNDSLDLKNQSLISHDAANNTNESLVEISFKTNNFEGNREESLEDERKLSPRFLPLIKKVTLREHCNNKTLVCSGELMECRHGYCKCQEDYAPRPDNPLECGERIYYNIEIPQTDPTMIGVVVGLCCMSVALCIVLRLFAKARFQENRTIFNTPNQRLMNVSLFKGPKKLFHTSRSSGRRGSLGSINRGDSVAFEQQQAITRRDFEERFLKSDDTEGHRQTPQQTITYPQNQPSTSRQAATAAATAVVGNDVSKFTKFKQQDSVTSSTTV